MIQSVNFHWWFYEKIWSHFWGGASAADPGALLASPLPPGSFSGRGDGASFKSGGALQSRTCESSARCTINVFYCGYVLISSEGSSRPIWSPRMWHLPLNRTMSHHCRSSLVLSNASYLLRRDIGFSHWRAPLLFLFRGLMTSSAEAGQRLDRLALIPCPVD